MNLELHELGHELGISTLEIFFFSYPMCLNCPTHEYFTCFTSIQHIANNVLSLFLCNEFPWFLYGMSPNLCLLIKMWLAPRLVLGPFSPLLRWETLWWIKCESKFRDSWNIFHYFPTLFKLAYNHIHFHTYSRCRHRITSRVRKHFHFLLSDHHAL